MGHKWVVEDPLTQGELAELEAQIGVRLPEEYRAFLLHVGAGGAGPAYGLFPVRCVQGRWRWEGDGADLADLSRLAEPFPDQGPDPELLEDVLAQRPEEEDFDDIEDFDDAIEAWDERWEAVITNTRAFSISASDYATLVLLSPFVRAVAAVAPGVTIYTLHMVSCAPTTSPPTRYEPSPTAPRLEPGRGANGHRGLPCRRARRRRFASF